MCSEREESSLASIPEVGIFCLDRHDSPEIQDVADMFAISETHDEVVRFYALVDERLGVDDL